MNIDDLIQGLEPLKNSADKIMAIVELNNQRRMYAGIFGNSQGSPTLMVYKEEPLPSVKKCNDLVAELKAWKYDSMHYKANDHVYLVVIHEYKDDSYDFRYFKVDLIENGEELFLISKSDESSELREHFEAFDEDMFDED